MNGYDFTNGIVFDTRVPAGPAEFMLFCASGEVRGLMDIFKWAEDTVEECANLDEVIRLTSYNGYDFVSLIYMEPENGAVSQKEINLFFSKRYLVVVLPEQPRGKLAEMRDKLNKAAVSAAGRSTPLVYLYYVIFDSLVSDFSDILEELEDGMETLSEAIDERPDKSQSKEIGRLRKTAYTYKKLLRALSYIGSQILIDENGLLDDGSVRYFRSVDARLVKLYGFAEHLFDLSNELLHTYDSRLTAQTNDMVNKLTAITLFFGPLSVIAGIYGMNFTDMPELRWEFGYPTSLLLMAAVSLTIYIILKKKKWL